VHVIPVAYMSYFTLALLVLEAREECMHGVVVIYFIILNLFVVGQGDSCGPSSLMKRGFKMKMSARGTPALLLVCFVVVLN
jgi:hypothetical protein